MTIRFGTDGVRGKAYEQLTVQDAARIGRAAASVFTGEAVVIGTDTRESGPDLVAGLAAGFAAGHMVPQYLGVAPTPAVAHLANTDNVVGAMVSASHNPWFDNGIKLFAPGGRKLTDAEQSALEAAIDELDEVEVDLTIADLANIEHRVGEYTSMVNATLDTDALAGLSVVIDAANGAASHIAGAVLADLGAEVAVVAVEPDGRNINDGCGSTHPEVLAAEVVRLGADVGVALDGDADRLVAVDHAGNVVDGDFVIAICAIDLAARGQLADNTVVVTVMTNLGFRLAMDERNINVAETGVGDRYVLESLEANGWVLGGEQSGHVIFRDLATTGDGLLTAVQLLAVVNRSDESLADLASAAMVRLPQVLRNVTVAEKVPNVAEILAPEIAAAEAEMDGAGRVLIRASGTEPVIRVMVEAVTAEQADAVCEHLVQTVRERFQ